MLRSPALGIIAPVLGIGGLVVLALGWQHADAETEQWRSRYVDVRAQLDAAGEAAPPDEWAARIRAACQDFPDMSLCDDWTQVAPEDLDRPRVTS